MIMDFLENKQNFIARRLKLRNLHTFLAIVEPGAAGGMVVHHLAP
jgi:hypothetical protein